MQTWEKVALALMASGGADAITLRAIARETGMTANAIYGYFATRDDLVTTLIDDVYTALADTVETAWPQARHLYADSTFDWSDFEPGLLDKVRPAFPDLPPAAVALALALRIWGHMHTQTTSPEKLFQEELAQLMRMLGLPRRS